MRWMKQGTQSRCSGTTQRGGVGMEVGGEFRMVGHTHPWLIHVNVWRKPPQYCEVISFQLKYFFKKRLRHLTEHLFISVFSIVI